MALRLAQENRAVGDDRWKWSIWLEGPDQELDTVQSVRYFLHSTFRNPVREVTDRHSKFRLDSIGWGEFRIIAHVQKEDQSVELLSAWLHLLQPDTRRVFVSAQSSDIELAMKVADVLREHGIEVLGTVGALSPGDSFDGQLDEAVMQADAVVAIVTLGHRSVWVGDEIERARKVSIPVYPVLASPNVSLPEELEDMSAYTADNANDLDTLAMTIRGLDITT